MFGMIAAYHVPGWRGADAQMEKITLMQDQEPRGPVSSSSWTGLDDETANTGAHHPFEPPLSMLEKDRTLMAMLLFGAGLLLFTLWFAQLTLHSPTAPAASNGHTEAVSLGQKSGSPMYVTIVEARITLGLLLGMFVLPGGFLAWDSLRSRVRP